MRLQARVRASLVVIRRRMDVNVTVAGSRHSSHMAVKRQATIELRVFILSATSRSTSATDTDDKVDVLTCSCLDDVPMTTASDFSALSKYHSLPDVGSNSRRGQRDRRRCCRCSRTVVSLAY